MEIEVNNLQSRHTVDFNGLEAAIHSILVEENVRAGTLSLAVVDDDTMHQLNRRYLGHNEPTDVLSFVFQSRGDYLEGEVVVSADTAAACAPRFGWSLGDELLLYVTHGVLHLLGYDDQTPEDRQRMRSQERHHLARFGLEPHYEAVDSAFRRGRQR